MTAMHTTPWIHRLLVALLLLVPAPTAWAALSANSRLGENLQDARFLQVEFSLTAELHLGSRGSCGWTTAECSVAPSGTGKFLVGPYNELKGQVPGLDAHHVGQQAAMKRLVPGYDPATVPSILVPKVGHTIRGPNGIVSRST